MRWCSHIHFIARNRINHGEIIVFVCDLWRQRCARICFTHSIICIWPNAKRANAFSLCSCLHRLCNLLHENCSNDVIFGSWHRNESASSSDQFSNKIEMHRISGWSKQSNSLRATIVLSMFSHNIRQADRERARSQRWGRKKLYLISSYVAQIIQCTRNPDEIEIKCVWTYWAIVSMVVVIKNV